ncbi:MAG: glycosyltransferase family 2 protein [Candidatus Micrarchaeota archaeon]
MNISFIVLNYNGEQVLEKTLKAIYKEKTIQDEVLVVDNNSNDSSRKIALKFKGLKWFQLKENKRLLALNDAALKAKHEFICILNNDYIIQKGYRENAVKTLESDDKLFGVSAKVIMPTGLIDYAYCIPHMKNFLFQLEIKGRNEKNEGQYKEIKPTISANIVGVFRKKVYNEIGGIDELFYPAYWEDNDLGYNAWKRGWKILFNPKMSVIHNHKDSMIKSLGKSGATTIANRNKHLFILKNFSSKAMLARYLIALPIVLILGTLKQGLPFLNGFIQALGKASEALAKKKESEKNRVLSDEEIFSLTGGIIRP